LFNLISEAAKQFVIALMDSVNNEKIDSNKDRPNILLEHPQL